MAKRNTLTDYEAGIVKKLLEQGNHTNQEIAGLINRSRGDASRDVSSGRITNIKQNDIQKYVPIEPASEDEVSFFLHKLNAYDPQTGLNFYDDERLIRAREAMILAVQIFNSPSMKFKTEVFSVIANIAWTYLLHEFYLRKNVNIIDADGRALLLSKMLNRDDCPLSSGIKSNLNAMKIIRDDVEHQLLRKGDLKWLPIYQACCLNFDKALRDLFGEKLSLQKELSFAIQFSKMDVEQLSNLQDFEIPEHIKAIDARLREGLTEEQRSDLEYQFRVVYTLDSASKSQSHMRFLHPDSEEADKVRNVLVKHKLADDVYPYKPSTVTSKVAAKTGKKFTSHNHAQAWKLYKARPKTRAKQPANTDKKYCIYHKAHKDYTYSEEWVEFLAAKVADEKEFAKIKNHRN